MLDGAAGDIVLANGDLAEEFVVATDDEVEPGSLLVLDDDANLRLSRKPYDHRLAGVAAGAGANRPAILLNRKAGPDNKVALALAGRVFCKVDASYGAVNVGDLLTSSMTPGYAMKAVDGEAGLGTIVGKALSALANGRALIPILVTML